MESNAACRPEIAAAVTGVKLAPAMPSVTHLSIDIYESSVSRAEGTVMTRLRFAARRGDQRINVPYRALYIRDNRVSFCPAAGDDQTHSEMV